MKKRFLGCIFILIFPVFVQANELTADYYDIAENYYHANNMARALEYTDLILTINPSDEKALELRKKIMPVLINSSSDDTKRTLILEQYSDSDGIQIIETPSVNTTVHEYNSNYYNIKGQEFFYQEDYNSAIQYFEKSISLDKNNFKAYNNLAMAYWKKGYIDEAVENFKIANRKNPLYTQALTNLANLYMYIGDYKKAEKTYLKAINLNPSDAHANCCLGDYYRMIKKYPEAIKYYQEAINTNKKYANAYLKLAISFFETEEFGYCISTLEQYLELNPNSDFACMLAAKSYSAATKYSEAEKYINQAIAINDCNKYRIEQAKIKYNLGEYSDAKALFEKILQNDESAVLFNYLGLCFYKQKDVNAAMLNFNKAITEDPLRPVYYYNLAQCFKTLNDKINYAKNINTATKIRPQNYQDYIDLSYIYFDNANPTYAINILNDGIKAYPDLKSLYLSKLKIYEIIGDNINYGITKNIIEKKFDNYEKDKKSSKEKK